MDRGICRENEYYCQKCGKLNTGEPHEGKAYSFNDDTYVKIRVCETCLLKEGGEKV